MPQGFTNDSSAVDNVDMPAKLFQSQITDTGKMNLLSKVFALEEMFKVEVAKLRSEVEFQNLKIAEGDEGKYLQGPDRVGNIDPKTLAEDEKSWSFRTLDYALPAMQWVPLGVRSMPVLAPSSLAQEPLALDVMTSFPQSFLVEILGGTEWSPGLFYPANGAKEHSKQLRSMLKSKSYYVMDAEFEPFLPNKPAQHGAKLTVFFREIDASQVGIYENVPLFVALPDQKVGTGENLYTYLGTYSQKRWSDKLDFDRVQDVVPMHVKHSWACKLVDPRRETWLERALMEHFWPIPKYEGRAPEHMSNGTPTATGTSVDENGRSEVAVREDVKNFIDDLVEWEKEAKVKVGLLKKENILEAFTKEDAAEEPGLRFWWEYLQCVGFDRNFYYLLATAKRQKEAGTNASTKNATI